MESIALVVVGAENLVESGGILNKIGTYTIAMAAKAYNKPFYVMAESLKYMEYYPIQQDDIPASIKVRWILRCSVLVSCHEKPLNDRPPSQNSQHLPDAGGFKF